MEKMDWKGNVPGLRHSGGETHILREVMRIHQAILNVFSREFEMPMSRLGLLRLLALCYPEATGILELARRLGINASAVTRRVQELERLGWVQRLPDQSDRRRSSVKLSAKGRKQFVQIHEHTHEFEDSIQAGLTDQELLTAAKVLSVLRETLEKMH
jgi:DNA-binding MarR family transcriptional regulator